MNDSLPFSPYYKLRVLQIGLIKQQLSLSLSLALSCHSLTLFFALVFSPSFSLDVAATNSVKMTGAQRRRFAKQFPEGVSRARAPNFTPSRKLKDSVV